MSLIEKSAGNAAVVGTITCLWPNFLIVKQHKTHAHALLGSDK